jgi:UDP-N-acetylmuramoylalanine-D-glutamate ligase
LEILSSDKNRLIVEGGQYLVEVEQALTEIFKLLKAEQYLVEVEQALTKIFKFFKANLKILSELVLLLPNTDSFQQFVDFCHRLFYFY